MPPRPPFGASDPNLAIIAPPAAPAVAPFSDAATGAFLPPSRVINNITLLEATPPSAVSCVSPVIDTLSVSFCSVASRRLKNAEMRLRSGQKNGDATVETDRWRLTLKRLPGENPYFFYAEGLGGMTGIRVIWGYVQGAEPGSTVRQFKVFIGSEPLWRHRAHGGTGYSCARENIGIITGDLWSVAPALDQVKVRRVDVCVDHWGYEWSKSDTDKFACRQKNRGIVEHGEWKKETETDTFYGPESATYYVGSRSGGTRYLRIYNKIAEAKKSGKLPWLEPIWEKFGWDKEKTVWRAEVQHNGEWLKDHGLDSLEKLKGAEHALLNKYFEDVRHTLADRTRLKRCESSAVWAALTATAKRCAAELEPSPWVWCPRHVEPSTDMKAIGAMAAGCLRKVCKTMFKGEMEAPEFLAWIQEAMVLSEASAARRDAKKVILT